ncbi:MAG: hypothetical protein M3437_01660, partial [Chloroflexota bacterium]|nr:hypothetical protein [Chloroflexota bacterium]
MPVTEQLSLQRQSLPRQTSSTFLYAPNFTKLHITPAGHLQTEVFPYNRTKAPPCHPERSEGSA